MTARLTRLRIAGFKSFAEPVSLDILPGLTGIVGPNGCGKSNVVEALRWAMGETSARSLRGGEMDDVIFAGTTARASRNLAEVAITLQGAFPLPYEAEAELQVTRRIERGAGSTFRANGRELRARDVQTLYADLASGARSSGMVSQGRVAALVGARPEERRQVLEEAAGITGLHARRHEAELKLRAAEQNLSRAEDLRGQLDGTRDGLRRQARQAARYRAISGLVRAAEAEHLAVLHGQASHAVHAAEEAESRAIAEADAALREQQTSAAALLDAEAALPAPRAQEAHARAVLERRRVEAETMEAEAARVRQDAEDAAARLRDLEDDLADAARAVADCATSVQRIGGDRESLAARLAALPDDIIVASQAAAKARSMLQVAQTQADEEATEAAQANAAAALAEHAMVDSEARVGVLRARHTEAAVELATSDAARVAPAQLEAAVLSVSQAEETRQAAAQRFEDAETARATSAQAAQVARHAAEQARTARQEATGAREAAAARAARLAQAAVEAASTLAALQTERIPPEAVEGAASEADAGAMALGDAEACVDSAELAASDAASRAALAGRAAADAAEARARALEAATAARARAARLASMADEAEAACEAATHAAPGEAVLADAALALEAALEHLAHSETVLASSQADRTLSLQAAEAWRGQSAEAQADAARLAAECAGLRAALQVEDGQTGALDALHVPEGLEAAVGAALGEAAGASLDPSAERFWRDLPALAECSLPAGSVRLSALLDVTPALHRALSHVALLDADADGAALQASLPPGTALVDRAGGSWRWDGHVTRPGAANPAAARLALRRRLAAVEQESAAANGSAIQAHAAHAEAERAASAAGTHAEEVRTACVAGQDTHREALRHVEHLRAKTEHASARLAALQESARLARADHKTAADEAAWAESLLHGLPEQATFESARQHALALAEAAASKLDQVRAGRLAARARATALQTAAQQIAATASRIEAQAAASAPALARLQAECAEAGQAAQAAQQAWAALPNPAALQDEMSEAAHAATIDAGAEAEARAARRGAEAALEAARHHEAALRHTHLQAETRWLALSGTLERSAADLAAAEQSAALATQARAAVADPGALAEAARGAREACDVARAELARADTHLSGLQTALTQAELGVASLAAEQAAWQRRLDEATARHSGLEVRKDAAQSAWLAVSARPGEVVTRAARSGQALEAADAAHQAACAVLAAAESRVRALALAERDATRATSAGTERRLRAEAACAACHAALHTLLARIAERLGEAATLPPIPDLSADAEERARKKSERLSRERDEMGPVNLCADQELDELDQRIGTLDSERDELGAAIAKLRGAIGHLNREGRERLQAVFTQVDTHFRTLFTRMMGGGRAHLALTGADDPLLAGLEIYAEPPGKKLSALSLLSGGEQALTALSLIFAVFRCTPAPVCVLDEVDAPLDDANVDRFCTLLDDMARDTGTSFLVVTHHQLTMSRMNRLYGVTMQERGVSRLLSVDLTHAVAMVEPARHAAE